MVKIKSATCESGRCARKIMTSGRRGEVGTLKMARTVPLHIELVSAAAIEYFYAISLAFLNSHLRFR